MNARKAYGTVGNSKLILLSMFRPSNTLEMYDI